MLAPRGAARPNSRAASQDSSIEILPASASGAVSVRVLRWMFVTSPRRDRFRAVTARLLGSRRRQSRVTEPNRQQPESIRTNSSSSKPLHEREPGGSRRSQPAKGVRTSTSVDLGLSRPRRGDLRPLVRRTKTLCGIKHLLPAAHSQRSAHCARGSHAGLDTCWSRFCGRPAVEGVDASEDMLAMRAKAATANVTPVLHQQRMQELTLSRLYHTLFIPSRAFRS